MEHSNLQDLISCLEYGTNIHICVVFLEDFGNHKTELLRKNAVHTKPFCTYMHRDVHSSSEEIEKCIRCRDLALKKAVSGRKAFGGLCFNGVYEYCHPVLYGEDVAAVVFIGNILTVPSPLTIPFFETFERNFDEEQCARFAALIDNHIRLLLHEYPGEHNNFNPVINNMLNYIEEILYTDISLKNLAILFNYNEKYIGKLFKKHTGMTVKEYVNDKRLHRAETLLLETHLSITDISLKMGFNNVTYFNRLFKRKFGLSPSEYRKIKQ